MEALVLSGGGANGGFQAGALLALHRLGYRPDVVAGVSAGALNAVGYAVHGPEWLVDRWMRLRTRDVTTTDGVSRIAWRILRGALGLQRADGLARVVEEAVSGPLPEDAPTVLIGLVDYETGQYRTVHASELTVSELREAVIASATIPLQWPPVPFRGRLSVDGGVRRNVPLEDVLPYGPARVTTILTGPAQRPEYPGPRRIQDVARMTVETMLDEIARCDVEMFEAINRLVQEHGGPIPSIDGTHLHRYFRHRLIRPEATLGSSLDWESPPQSARIAHGYQLAMALGGS